MADVSLLRAGLARNLSPLSPGVQVSAYTLSEPTPPSVMVDIAMTAYDAAMQRGHDDWTFTILVIVGMATDIGAQKRLDEMIASHGPKSIKTLLESDLSLGGVAEDVTVKTVSVRTYTLDTIGGTQRSPYLGAEFTVEVMASGND